MLCVVPCSRVAQQGHPHLATAAGVCVWGCGGVEEREEDQVEEELKVLFECCTLIAYCALLKFYMGIYIVYGLFKPLELSGSSRFIWMNS